MKAHILVVEDEPGIADTIRYALTTDGFEPIVCATGAEAMTQVGDLPIALIVLDLGLPDINGFELFKRLQAVSDVPVIFLTARSDEIDRVVGLELGADDYMTKPFSPRELTARIRTVLRRLQKNRQDAPRPPASVSCINIDTERRRIAYYGHNLELSRYEYGLLKTLATRPGRVFSRDELLRLVWDAATDSFDRTVDAHIKTLRAKLHAVAPELEPILTHRGIGYALSDTLPKARKAPNAT